MRRRSVTLLYERSDAPFKTTAAIQERLSTLMSEPAVQEVIADLIAREMIGEDATFTFHGLRRKSAFTSEAVMRATASSSR